MTGIVYVFDLHVLVVETSVLEEAFPLAEAEMLFVHLVEVENTDVKVLMPF